MKTAPMAGKSYNPAMSPFTARRIGAHHTVETAESGREREWEGNCLGDE